MREENIVNQLFLTELCNENCLFCSYDRKKINLSNPTVDDLKRSIEKIKHGADVYLDGGEPTLRKDIFQIARLVKDKKPKRLTLCTNGLMLHYPKYVEKVKSVGIDHVTVSLHSHSAEICDRITRVKGSYEKTTSGIKRLIDLGVRVSISHVLNKLNYRDVFDFVKFVDSNFKEVNITFSFVMPAGNALYNKWIIPRITDVVPYLKKALKYCLDNRTSFSFTGCSIPPCFLEGYEKYTGEFLLANNKYVMERQSGERIRYISDGKIKPETCKECKFDNVCGGLWEKYVDLYGFNELPRVSQENSYEGTHGIKSNDYSRFNENLAIFQEAKKRMHFQNNIDLVFDSFLRNDIGYLSEDKVMNYWSKFIKSVNEKVQFDFYMNIPFCRSPCSYCIYPSTQFNQKDINDYVEYLKNKIRDFSDTFRSVKFKSLYVGGGTPSLLSTAQMENLFSLLMSNYNFHELSEKTIEFNPDSTSIEKLNTIKKCGFNRISMGVQSLSPSILKENNRGFQDKEIVKKVINDVKSVGVDTVSADLVLGLKGDTKEQFLDSFRTLASYKPDTIFIYPMETNTEYVLKNYSSMDEFNSYYYKLHASVQESIFKLADKLGYIQSSPRPQQLGFVHPTCFDGKEYRPKEKCVYGHRSYDQHAVFGVGYYSNPIIPNVLDYILIDKGNPRNHFLKKFSTNSSDYVYKAESFSPNFEKVRYVVLNLAHNRVLSRKEYASKFKNDIADDFKYPLDALEYYGIITIAEDYIRCVDLNEVDLFEYMLFFVGKKTVSKKLGIPSANNNLRMGCKF